MSRGLVPVITLVLVVAAFAPGAIGGVAAEDVTLTVTIVDSNGNELGNVPVTVRWDDGTGGPITRTTAPNGQVLFGVPEGADVELTVEDSENYILNFPEVVENVTDQNEEITVYLKGQATVTVEDANGPVENADVRLFRGARYVATNQTGPDGMTTTKTVERGSYGLQVVKSGYRMNGTSITVDSAMTNKTVQIRRGSVEVRFNVTDDTFEPPRPIENATVNIQGGASLPTLSNGLATTSVPVNRRYEVTVSKDGYDSVSRTLRVREEPVTLNVSIQRTDAISVTAANDRVVIGESTQVTVTDEYSNPVSGATVSVGGSDVGQTDENGQLQVPIETAGNTTINVEDGSLSASTSVEGVDPDADDATAAPTATETATEAVTETPGDSGPGFGILAAIVALAGALLLARRR